MGDKKFVVDDALRWRVFRQVGDIVRPTNPLIPLIPQVKSYDEWVEFTKTDLYKKLMDHENPICKPLIHPELRKDFEKLQITRKEIMADEGYPSYMRGKADRFGYRFLWAATLLMTSFSISNIMFRGLKPLTVLSAFCRNITTQTDTTNAKIIKPTLLQIHQVKFGRAKKAFNYGKDAKVHRKILLQRAKIIFLTFISFFLTASTYVLYVLID